VCVWWIWGWGERRESINPAVMILILFAIVSNQLFFCYNSWCSCDVTLSKYSKIILDCLHAFNYLELLHIFFKVIHMFLLKFNNNKRGFLKGAWSSTQYDHQRYAYGFLPDLLKQCNVELLMR
jgi:hypothetical protein